jgi:RNA polymerase sigma-70 factor (ECF subfamily)
LPDLETAAAKVIAGDIRAFDRIVAATEHELVRLAARLLGNQPDAEDVVQEAYVKAYRALGKGGFEGRSRVRTWLFQIVTHTAIDALRQNARRAPPSDLADESAAPAGQLEGQLALLELSHWLEVLPAEQRAAVVLKSIQGFSSKETADILGCSEGAIEQRLVRARATLRERRGTA